MVLLVNKQIKEFYMLTKNQIKVVEFLKTATNPVTLKEVKEKFHGKTLNTLIFNDIIKVEVRSRLREADMEMVYWDEVVLR
jgi:hypothetical protein